MYKIKVGIDGMMCGMCEAHICDTIRRTFPDAKKVKASRAHKEATFLAEEMPDNEMLAKAITDTGYTFISATAEPFKKQAHIWNRIF